jgi:hypothetical protein
MNEAPSSPSYSKTRLGADQAAGAISLSPRGKRIAYLIVALVVAAGVAVGVWSGVSSDRYQGSANGCVNVLIAGATGGATLHYCGAQAKTFCKSAFGNSDHVSLLARPQCDDAGLTAAKVGATAVAS